MKPNLSHTTKIELAFLFHLIIHCSIVISTSLGEPNIVKTLPGYPGNLPFTLETGYVGVGENEQVKLFYYFVESERDVKNDPLMIWLVGGPGCSALAAFFFQNGPLRFDHTTSNSKADAPNLKQNPYSWTKVANIIFLDSPVGTGFSYASTFEAYNSNDTLQGAHITDFLRKWLIKHPKFIENSLYISGDSYSGQIVPIVVQDILFGNEIGNKPKLNLKGYVLGNPITELDRIDGNARYTFAHRMSFLSDELYESAMINCKGDFVNEDAMDKSCLNNRQEMDQDLKHISIGCVLEDDCPDDSPNLFLMSKKVSWPLKSQPTKPLLDLKRRPCWNADFVLAVAWANNEKVREALYVQEGSKELWARCNNSILYESNIRSTVQFHVNLSKEPLRVLIYNGDQDMLVSYIGTLEWIKILNIPVTDNWRPWFVDGQVAGYATEFTHSPYRLVHATIKGGSHTAADFRPRECLAMIDRWLTMSPL